MSQTDDPRELERQIEQAKRLAELAGPLLAESLRARIKELEQRLAEVNKPEK